MPIFLQALLWAMFHPFSGVYHLAYWYHFPMEMAEKLSILSKIIDVVFLIALFVMVMLLTKKQATKIGDGTAGDATGEPFTLPQRVDDEEGSGTYGGPYQRHPKYPPGRDSKD